MLSSVDSTESVSSREESQDETLDEKEVVGQVQPYADEPLAHASERGRGRSLPACLQSRFEGEVSINEWLVLYIFSEPHKIIPTLECLLTRVNQYFNQALFSSHFVNHFHKKH